MIFILIVLTILVLFIDVARINHLKSDIQSIRIWYATERQVANADEQLRELVKRATDTANAANGQSGILKKDAQSTAAKLNARMNRQDYVIGLIIEELGLEFHDASVMPAHLHKVKSGRKSKNA